MRGENFAVIYTDRQLAWGGGSKPCWASARLSQSGSSGIGSLFRERPPCSLVQVLRIHRCLGPWGVVLAVSVAAIRCLHADFAQRFRDFAFCSGVLSDERSDFALGSIQVLTCLNAQDRTA